MKREKRLIRAMALVHQYKIQYKCEDYFFTFSYYIIHIYD